MKLFAEQSWADKQKAAENEVRHRELQMNKQLEQEK